MDLKKLKSALSGDPLARAQALLQQGDKAKAAEAFAKAGELKRAATLAAECGDKKMAVSYALRAVLGEVPRDLVDATPEQAGELLASSGRFQDALPLFELAQSWKQAAEAAAKLQQPERAARHYERAKAWDLAALYYERANRVQDALRNLERESNRLKTEGRAHREPRVEENIRRIDQRRAELLDKQGKQDEALGVLQTGAPSLKTARILEQTGKVQEAIEAYFAVGDRYEAQRLMRQLRPGSSEAAHATMKLVPLLVDEGKLDEARTRLNSLPPETDPGGSTAVERFYWQGRIAERQSNPQEALLNFQKVVAIRKDYRDAGRRLAAIRNVAQTEMQRAMTAGVTSPATPRSAATVAPGGMTAPPTFAARPGAVTVGAPAPGAALGATLPPTVGGGVRPASPEMLAVGALLVGRYDVIAELGRGGMGRVYKARDRELDETVAIKTLVRMGEPDPAEEERLLREVQICRRLTHANIVRVYDVGRYEGGIFVTMEYIEGERLDQLIRREQPVQLAKVKAILDEIAAGLQEAHANQVVHRDLKPNNVMVTQSGTKADRVKILDFGIARSLDSETRLTRSGLAIGTPLYMSPEQLRGQPLDGRSDLYALGVVAYTLLTGREPFHGDNPTTIAIEHLQKPAPDPRKLRTDLPEPWVRLVLKLLEKEPELRHPTAASVRAALSQLPI